MDQSNSSPSPESKAAKLKPIGKTLAIGCAVVALLVLIVVVIVLMRQSKDTDLPTVAPPAAYIGEWEGEDGTRLAIQRNGVGNYATGSSRLVNGRALIDEKEGMLKITGRSWFSGGKTWEIDQAPIPRGGVGLMKLDGVAYRRAEGSPPGIWNDTGDIAPVMPSESYLAGLVRKTLLDFNQAVRDGDFEAFHESISNFWHDETSAGELEDIFSEFIAGRIDIGGIADLTPTLSPPPQLGGDHVLVIGGFYTTSSETIYFQVRYVNEDDLWKLAGIWLKAGGKDAIGKAEGRRRIS